METRCHGTCVVGSVTKGERLQTKQRLKAESPGEATWLFFAALLMQDQHGNCRARRAHTVTGDAGYLKHEDDSELPIYPSFCSAHRGGKGVMKKKSSKEAELFVHTSLDNKG